MIPVRALTLALVLCGFGCAKGDGNSDTLRRVGEAAHDAACTLCSYVTRTCGDSSSSADDGR